MFLVALRNILQEKGRLIISLAGVTFAIILMVVLMGIYSGAIKQFTRFIDENPTDLVIAQKGINDYFHGASLLPNETVAQVEGTSGVADVVPMISQIAFLDHGDKKYDVFISSFVKDKAQGAPWDVTGTLDIGNEEIIISDSLAKKIDKSINDTIVLANKDFTIRGLVPDASSFGTHYAWVNFNTAQAMTKLPIVSFIYVTLDNSSQSEQIASQLIERLPNSSVLTKQEFTNNNKSELEEIFLPIIGAIVGIAIIVGTAVIGLTIYTATLDKAKEYGVLKAIGVSNGQLFRIVFTQSLLSVTAGFILGVGISIAISPLLKNAMGIPPTISGPIVGGTAAISIIMGVLAAFVPLRRITRIDPAEVFKS